MSSLIRRLERNAATAGETIALQEPGRSLTWSEMLVQAKQLAGLLSLFQQRVIALEADNGIDWILVDLACLLSDVILLPIPGFFSASQRQHALEQSGAEALIRPAGQGDITVHAFWNGLSLETLSPVMPAQLPAGTRKITFTSGSTGQPKGVCLSETNQVVVAESLIQSIRLAAPRHLCILPLPTLLENIAGVYAPLLAGGRVVVLPMQTVGFNGGRGFDIHALTVAIDHYQPHSLIMMPELLSALLLAVKQGWQSPTSLDFIAVGGSRVAPQLIHDANKAGLPVFEGYGLSECSSVVSLNTATASLAGSAGKPLPHISIRTEQGEIVVEGNAFLGYVGEPDSWYPSHVDTGDMGALDADGFLHIEGRKKNLLISSFGRNINPEWIESEVLANPLIAQCIVLGDARPHCVALIHPRHGLTTDADIENWLQQVNRNLPDYAQIQLWQRLQQALSLQNGMLTANGKPIRDRITACYQNQIDDLYRESA